jgi:hypothetical protein
MQAVVINRITLSVPAGEVLADIEREVVPVLAALDGFVGFTLVQTGPAEVVVIIRWTSVDAAAAGAGVLGPGAFNTWIAPRATGQDRVVGTVAMDAGWGSGA